MSISISYELSEWEQEERIPNGGVRIAVNGERVHRFYSDKRPIGAKQPWGPTFIGVYPDLDLANLLDTINEVRDEQSASRQQEFHLCECRPRFIFERLDETYIRLAVQSEAAVPEVQRGYLVETDELMKELIEAIDRFLVEVDENTAPDADVAGQLRTARNAFDP